MIGVVAAAAALGVAGCGGSAEKVAVKVNKDVITETEFTSRVASLDVMTFQAGSQQGAPGKAGEFVIRQLILEKLIIQAAAQKNITASDAEIAAYVTFAKKYPTAPGAMGDNPLRDDAAFIRDGRTQIVIRKMALGPLKLTEADYQKVYEQFKPQLKEPEQYHLRIVQSTTLKKSQDALASLNKGVAFETVALSMSEDPLSRQKNGDIGMLPETAIPAALTAAVRGLKPNDYSKAPIRVDTPNPQAAPGTPPQVATRYFLAQLVERKASRTPAIDEVRPIVEYQALMAKDPGAQARIQQELREFTLAADIQMNLKQYEDIVKKLKAPPTAPPSQNNPMPAAPPR